MSYKYRADWRVKLIKWIARRLGFSTVHQTLRWAKGADKKVKYNVYLERFDEWNPQLKLVEEEV